jgi:hypothetical protein
MELEGYMIDKWNENGIGFLKITKEKLTRHLVSVLI